MSNELITARYDALLEDIAGIYHETRKTLAEAYWKIGERIVRVDQDGEVRAAYGKNLLDRVSQDLLKKHGLGFSVKNLERMRTFYLSNPKSSASTNLTWSHYVELLGVADERTRRRLEKLAARDGLSTRELRRLVQEEGPGGAQKADLAPLVRPVNLTLHTYAPAFSIGMDVPSGSRPVDLGFGVQVILSEEALQGVTLTSRPCYAYPATIERVVDGDTFLAEIDLGFGIFVKERLRLRGIDAPEMKTAEGLKARDEVMKLLPRGTRIVMRSYKTDIYGRFVADVIYLGRDSSQDVPGAPGDQQEAGTGGSVGLSEFETIARDGVFLNQELVERGFAVRVK